MQREHRDFLLFAVGAGEVLVLAVEQFAVGAVPGLDDLEAFVDLTTQRGISEVFADEDRPGCSAELFERLIGRVLRTATGEAPQDLLRASAVPSFNAVAYLTSWSYCRAIRSQSIERLEITAASPGHTGSSGSPGRAAPMRFRRGSSRNPRRRQNAKPTIDAPWVSV
jgi:hypothetical protein